MQGFFKATVHDASHLGNTPEEMDRPFLEAIKTGRIIDFLAGLPVAQKAETPNQIFDMLPSFLGRTVWGMPDYGPGWQTGGSGGLAQIELVTLSTEPVYTEGELYYLTYPSDLDSDSVGANYLLWKLFIEEHSEPHRIWIDQGGREGYYFRDRFLWLPSDGLMQDIRGARIQYQDNADAGDNERIHRGWLSRTRFKDSGGSPVTLEKLASQSFLVEYVLRFFSR